MEKFDTKNKITKTKGCTKVPFGITIIQRKKETKQYQ